eukprot:715548_1
MTTQKPRTPRTKRSKNEAKPNNQSINTESSYFDSAYTAVSELTILQKVGLTVSAMALISTAVIRLSSSTKHKKRKGKKGKSLGTTKGNNGFETITFNNRSKDKNNKIEKIPTSQITKAFQACLSSKRPQQQLVADKFYAEINKWYTDQLDVDGRTIVVNFLFWYYRSANVPETKFHSQQAEHIRYWADYPITNDIKWDYYNIKFDYMYSTALLQKSIPHMKKFYSDINKETPRTTPEDAKSRKPNYYLTKYQAACILGDWEEGIKTAGQIIRDISNKATSSTATRNDYFMHYTLRALEMPASNPNFGLIYKIVEKLINEFPLSLLPPPVFANWNILSFKYKNVEKNVSYLTDQEFIYASDKIKDDDQYYVFYPQTSSLTSRINKKINIWGRVCQVVSPVFGAAGFLPLTGGWSDTKLYLETNWTFRGSGNRLTRKHVIMRVERMPFEQEVESKDYFGQKQNDKGYIWKGYITIHMKKLKKGLTIKDLYDEQGEDYFDGEKAIKQKQKKELEKNENKENNKDKDDDVKGNGAIVSNVKDNNDKDNNDNKNESEKKTEVVNNDDTLQETQIYEVELIINTNDPSGKDKELREKILAAVTGNTNSNSSTP